MNKQDFFKEISSMENLFLAWDEFIKGKKQKLDVLEFSLHLSENIYKLHSDLLDKSYTHGGYTHFNISDPKPRNISKASVRDRLLHHAIYRVLYPYFDQKFIHDSYSCRKWKGTHRAMDRFREFSCKVSQNNTKQCWVLKCDVRKFFASIDHQTLKEILKYNRLDQDTLWLLDRVIDSFHTPIHISVMTDMCIGLPLGNLTSQLLVNIYMNEFDQYVKHRLKVKYYIRYADDFVILDQNKTTLNNLLRYIKVFLENHLKLNLHPNKISIKTLASGVDFLGWVNFPHHRVLRTTTKRRMLKNLSNNLKPESVRSYFGMLKHGNAHKLQNEITKLSDLDAIHEAEEK
ncbi:MAG: hypothetical protein A3G99_01085 [Candidatus Zambryskibacteria bacterium RIFCSPLOWO2_12_FULL_39_23]|uniref:Reverse transcriptase domain-containing protein n=1 Tax=Candidatus Zambryskibacteria bacterium RIFCSPLOWO2_12_FULL_39_23 TaxID=1802776 RepID=A0A1G2UR74_9BACT|nr:MAG: hypothetical protein A3G99_01085 [Candidatus Zambryskibacteria bacterium RIFCSPLOWO2_12_FULL_39_23]